MTSLEFINKEIELTKTILNNWTEALEENPYAIVLGKSVKEYVEEYTKHLNHLKQIKDELEVKETNDELKKLLCAGNIFSPREFYDNYKGCLKGDGLATFVTKDLKFINDFDEGWKLLEEAVDDYNFLSHRNCKIAFVIWFNR